MADPSPRETIYVNNINEKVSKEELKKSLYAAFSQFGPILDVVALKTFKMRGQAFIVFRDITAATQAVRQMQGFPFYEKPLMISYANSKSDAVAKLDGSYEAKDKAERAAKRKADREERKEAKKAGSAKPKEVAEAGAAATAGGEDVAAACPEGQRSRPFFGAPGLAAAACSEGLHRLWAALHTPGASQRAARLPARG